MCIVVQLMTGRLVSHSRGIEMSGKGFLRLLHQVKKRTPVKKCPIHRRYVYIHKNTYTEKSCSLLKQIKEM